MKNWLWADLVTMVLWGPETRQPFKDNCLGWYAWEHAHHERSWIPLKKSMFSWQSQVFTDAPDDPGGPQYINTTQAINLTEVESLHPEVRDGHWSPTWISAGLPNGFPTNCTARDRVAVIIPFRNRHAHLSVLMKYLHKHLQRQLIEYTIFIIEQVFLNTGLCFTSLKSNPYQCTL